MSRFPVADRHGKGASETWPGRYPLFVRISATDWAEGGWDLPQSIELSRRFKDVGVDLIDCSSGAMVGAGEDADRPRLPGAVRRRDPARGRHRNRARSGMITEPKQAEQIIAEGKADVVLLARAMLRDPYWPLHAAQVLGADVRWPVQYERAAK